MNVLQSQCILLPLQMELVTSHNIPVRQFNSLKSEFTEIKGQYIQFLHQRKHCILVTKTKLLMMFREVVDTYSENRANNIHCVVKKEITERLE
jgi:hypothetical protein